MQQLKWHQCSEDASPRLLVSRALFLSLRTLEPLAP